MKLKELLVKVFEGHCKREDGESDEDFLTRCGNEPWMPVGNINQRSNLPGAMKVKMVVPIKNSKNTY
jgi:hypothetical protein